MTSAVGDTDVEAELSYAFLHAVASQAQATCEVAGRLSDSRGIDARLTSWGPFPTGGLREVSLNVQLKATVASPTDHGTHFSYSLKKVSQYNDLRAAAYAVPRILVVLFLPPDPVDWLAVTDTALALKRSAYWVSLVDAPYVTTESVTVHIPKANLLTPDSLKTLFQTLSQGNLPKYVPKGDLA